MLLVLQPQKPRAISGFGLYVKEHYRIVKAGNHPNKTSINPSTGSSLSHGEVMKTLSTMYAAEAKSRSDNNIDVTKALFVDGDA
jgi:hypothetical protein